MVETRELHLCPDRLVHQAVNRRRSIDAISPNGRPGTAIDVQLFFLISVFAPGEHAKLKREDAADESEEVRMGLC
ncbi:MAG: hypothetical protein L0387_28615 [Acidobacteria bacterium]|nr:hypothetical protein [Acidobacteriota bacterium]MCI0625563.1 hypothetical protein [Acidobacteriota bacterium]MCI0719552.1 hypothetical protein [Acidobacteriota bacterium]